MKRRDFVQLSGLGAGALMLPTTMMGNSIPVEALLNPGMDTVVKKRMADVALNTAKSMGSTYADARIGQIPEPICLHQGRQSTKRCKYRIFRNRYTGNR